VLNNKAKIMIPKNFFINQNPTWNRYGFHL
jgi:hypothetical protein